MTPIQRMRRNFIVALVVLGLADVSLAVYLRWPGSTRAVQKSEEENLNSQLKQKNAQAAPLHGIEKKLTDSQQQIRTIWRNDADTFFRLFHQ